MEQNQSFQVVKIQALEGEMEELDLEQEVTHALVVNLSELPRLLVVKKPW